jgi:hypothetical protein
VSWDPLGRPRVTGGSEGLHSGRQRCAGCCWKRPSWDSNIPETSASACVFKPRRDHRRPWIAAPCFGWSRLCSCSYYTRHGYRWSGPPPPPQRAGRGGRGGSLRDSSAARKQASTAGWPSGGELSPVSSRAARSPIARPFSPCRSPSGRTHARAEAGHRAAQRVERLEPRLGCRQLLSRHIQRLGLAGLQASG